jgi:hypothetical protein
MMVRPRHAKPAPVVIGREVSYTVDGAPKVHRRTFMDAHSYSLRAWREGLAVAHLGDLRGWARIDVKGIRDVTNQEG